MYDNQDDESNEWGRYNYPPQQQPQALKPGDPGYRPSIWANDYNPGPSWNNGQAPEPTNVWNMTNNSWIPLQEALGAKRETPLDAPKPTVGGGDTPTPPPTHNDGGVRPLPAPSINIPSAQLPSDISSLFNKVPEKTPIQSAYQDALLKYMDRGFQTPTLDDSILGPQTEVFRVQQQRNQERNRRNVAERAAANGQSQSGFLDRQINKGIQEQGFNTAAFNANLLGSELTKRREELQAALQLASATGNAEATRELQARLAQVSAMMQQQGLNLQGQLGAGDLALRASMAQMGNDQFYDQLGVNSALNMEGLNQRALQLIMGGG